MSIVAMLSAIASAAIMLAVAIFGGLISRSRRHAYIRWLSVALALGSLSMVLLLLEFTSSSKDVGILYAATVATTILWIVSACIAALSALRGLVRTKD